MSSRQENREERESEKQKIKKEREGRKGKAEKYKLETQKGLARSSLLLYIPVAIYNNIILTCY